jgi:protein-disulfide isomerase
MAQSPTQPVDREKIVRYLRDHFAIPESVKITANDVRESIYPEFLELTVTVDDGKNKQAQPFFVSKDMRYLVEGSIFNLGGDPKDEISRLISLKDQASQGPVSAPVTLVEYSDLQCPVCARLQEELETEVVPKYGDKLRVVFKELPLVSIHDWAFTGAIAAQCAYQIDPSKYVAFRSEIYKNQESVSAEHARDLLLHFAAEAGIDNLKLAACIDSQSSLSRVEANVHEAQALGISQTPTSFINGRAIVAAPPASEFFKLIEEALRDSK